MRSVRAGKSALGWLLAALLAAGPIQAQDIGPNPPGSGVVVTDSGLVMPVREVHEGGFRVTTTCGREGFVSSGTYLGGVDVVLDPGHGGSESGAIGSNSLAEKDLNLAVAQKAATELRAHGYSVLLTRTTDVRMPVSVRSEIARALDPYVFVSIHHNGGAVRRSSNPGTETYHQARNPDSARLAGILYERIHSALSQYDIGWRTTVLRGANAVVRRRDGKDLYGVLQYTPGLTSVITEAAYLSTPAEARLLADPDVQETEARAIAHGIIQYLTTDSAGSGYNGTVITSRRLYSGKADGCVDPPLVTQSPSQGASRHKDATPGEETSAVDALDSQGILRNTDCGPALFCPDDPVQRWVMAVWLVRILEDQGPKPVQASRFVDVDPSKWWAPYVERLADLGITQGCAASPARFCPHGYVRRDQMATFAVRAFQLGGGPAGHYSDTVGNPHSINIKVATNAGVVDECATSPARYCPHLPASRAEAAALLHRAANTLTANAPPAPD